MSYVPTAEQAEEILRRYNSDPFHLRHGKTVSGVMRYFSKEFDPEREEFWAAVGMLHDLDFEQWPEEHCSKEQKLMEELELDPELIHACMSHGWGITVDVKPEQTMENVLYATDELTGLIGAAAQMRPSRSVDDMELKSLKKKYKANGFAAGCSREVIGRGAELLGWELNELLTRTLDAMKSLPEELRTF